MRSKPQSSTIHGGQRRMRGYLGFGAVVLLFASHASSEAVAVAPSTFKGLSPSGGSGVALAKFNGSLVALVADEDDSAIHVFDTKPPKEIATAKVPGVPGQVLVTKSGQVLVALRDKGQVAVLEAKLGDPRQLVQRASIETGGEPIALATTPDETTLIVGSAFTHEISGWSLADRMAKFRVDVAREPRAIAISSDGAKAFVTHAVGGTISIVDIANATATAISPQGIVANATRTRVETQGFAIVESNGKMLVPMVMADPETPETYYGSSMETFGVVVVDEGTNAVTGTMVNPNRAALERCLLPRAAAVVQGHLLVGCAGETEMQMVDATSNDPMQNAPKTKSLGDSPSAMAFDDASQMLVVWSQMNRTVTAASFAYGAPPATNVTIPGGPIAAIARGRKLFHDVSGKVANDGRACASCHTDGRDDGLVWSTPEGNRQTPTLVGRLQGTAPYGWTRNAKTFSEYVAGTIQRLNGAGFNPVQLGDLEAYVMSLKAPKNPAVDATLAEKGARLFSANGCASCHSGATTTDGVAHPVAGSGTNANIATPSLKFVGATAPYFHDGRYKNLHALLTSNDSDMGRARALPSTDLDALEAYLKSL